MEFEEGNEWNAKTLEFDKELQVLIQYGVWNDSGDRDTNGNKYKGDRNMDNIQKIMILDNAKMLAMGALTAAASTLFLY